MAKNEFADVLAARDPRDPCPTCVVVGGYCGGENHPSCGLFADGRPVTAEPPWLEDYNLTLRYP